MEQTSRNRDWPNLRDESRNDMERVTHRRMQIREGENMFPPLFLCVPESPTEPATKPAERKWSGGSTCPGWHETHESVGRQCAESGTTGTLPAAVYVWVGGGGGGGGERLY